MQLYQNDVTATAHTLGVSVQHVEHWKQGVYEIPHLAVLVLERLNAGWTPRAEWKTNRMWLADTLQRHGQTPTSLSQALGIALATAKRYVRFGCGPKHYLMHAIELWLDGNPPPVVPKRRGRPPQQYTPTPDEAFAKRCMEDPDFSARYEIVLAALLRPNSTPAEKLEDMALARSTMGY